MEHFKKIPKNYQEGINKAIGEFWGEENKEIADKFRDNVAEMLLECEIHETDEIGRNNIDNWMDKLCWFAEGWKARDLYEKQPNLL